jgi:hypothetical protein
LKKKDLRDQSHSRKRLACRQWHANTNYTGQHGREPGKPNKQMGLVTAAIVAGRLGFLIGGQWFLLVLSLIAAGVLVRLVVRKAL